MEISWLLTDQINLEQEKFNLEQSGLAWEQIEHILRSKYGESSKKGLFRCQCCQSITTIVLSNAKACHFKHKSKEECAAKTNYNRSLRDTSFQNNQIHRIGKSVIRNQLVNNLVQYQANVMDGYLYRKELKYVPDFIVEWPNGETWSFDYITGTKSDSYQNYLLKKQAYYRQLNFKSYFLYNENQIAYHEEYHALALSHGEKGALPFLSRHSNWENIISDLEERYGADVIVPDMRLKLFDKQVQRLVYITNEFNGLQYFISRLAPKANSKLPDIPKQWYMVIGEPMKLPLDDLFRYQEKGNIFSWEEFIIDSEALDTFVRFIENNLEVANSKRIEENRILIDQKKSLSWEEEEFNIESEALDTFVQSIENNREVDKSKRIEENHSFNDQKKPISNVDNSYWQSQRSDKHQQLLTNKEKIREYERVISLMKISDKRTPNFSDRIKECESYIEKYKKDGIFPSKLNSKVNMMRIALGMEPVY